MKLPKRQVQGAQQTVGQHIMGTTLPYALFYYRKRTIPKRILPTPQKIYNRPSSYLLRPIESFPRPGSVFGSARYFVHKLGLASKVLAQSDLAPPATHCSLIEVFRLSDCVANRPVLTPISLGRPDFLRLGSTPVVLFFFTRRLLLVVCSSASPSFLNHWKPIVQHG